MSGFRQTVVLLSVIGLLFIGCKDIATAAPHARTQSVSLLPEIRGFLAKHQNWGTPGRVQAEPNWARGRRQRVTLSGRSLLFYTEGGKVVTVYEDMPSGRKKIWGSYSSPAVQRPKRSRASASLPAYTIPFSVSKFGGGGVIGDAIIPSMTPRTPVAERARVAKAIAAVGWDSCSR